ncbi:DJ-1/PfpI family protein [Enterovirga rhinocerotis]|uniref:Cyclohexyl-isocyanide hydratase n=1 Tax=Enterovirga rhinocerotis TaxID=1339210 RepID=A0A4R7BZA2_9HYPH|nr:DJ-1/PfpI family protein [Enterovirga rhinocerotis]TDR90095.1 cyclohexyl-isocyanide hydratase [Enterovirga rhinocerotis]
MTVNFGILCFPRVQQLDLTGPFEVFASARGATAHLVWKDLTPVRSATGLMLQPTVTFADAPAFDVLCVPGGSGVNPLLEDEETLDFIRRQSAGARFVTSVCTGALVLGAAGLLKGKRATTHWDSHQFLANFGAIPEQGRVVRDGNVFTAGGVTSGIDFGLAVVAELFGREEAETIQLYMEYAPQPPFDAGTPETAPAAIVEKARQSLAPSRQAKVEILERLGLS